MTHNQDNYEGYDPEEESFAPDEVARRRLSEEEERMKRRIRREIIRVNSGEHDDEIDEERRLMDEEAEEQREQEEQQRKKEGSLWRLLTTGSFLTSSDAGFYYRFLIAIAAMCFVSIFLTFMSLNAERECRRLEEQAKILRERSIIIDEKRYSISSKSEVERMLEERGILLIDLSNSSRLIEKER